mgnify:CR=1 FL=1
MGDLDHLGKGCDNTASCQVEELFLGGGVTKCSIRHQPTPMGLDVDKLMMYIIVCNASA